MHWVYVLKSSRIGSVYVGETIRLGKRWNEHQTGRGGVNTSEDDYDTCIGAYKVCNNSTFLQYYDDMVNNDRYAYRCQQEWGICEDKYRALQLEDHITERYFHESDEDNDRKWLFVAGGKYTSEQRSKKFCMSDKINNVLLDRPLCHCRYPCEVHMTKDKTKIYFTCPIPDWVDWFKCEEKCDFWEEFKPYRKILEGWQNRKNLTAAQVFADEIKAEAIAIYKSGFD